MATRIAQLARKSVTVVGEFPTMARQYMPITYVSPLPPGWTRGEWYVVPPAGVYLYQSFFNAGPINEWSSGGTIVARMGSNRILQCDGSQQIYLRMLPENSPITDGFILTPL